MSDKMTDIEAWRLLLKVYGIDQRTQPDEQIQNAILQVADVIYNFGSGEFDSYEDDEFDMEEVK